jgi:regulatory protein
VDDGAFARAVAEHAFGNRRAGERSVRAALAGKGVPPEVAAAAIEEFGGDEEARALELARSRVSRLHALPPERAYARLVGFLARRGYPPSLAREAARRALEVDAPDG